MRTHRGGFKHSTKSGKVPLLQREAVYRLRVRREELAKYGEPDDAGLLRFLKARRRKPLVN